MKSFKKYKVLLNCRRLSFWAQNSDFDIYRLSVFIHKNGGDNSFCDSSLSFCFSTSQSNDTLADGSCLEVHQKAQEHLRNQKEKSKGKLCQIRENDGIVGMDFSIAVQYYQPKGKERKNRRDICISFKLLSLQCLGSQISVYELSDLYIIPTWFGTSTGFFQSVWFSVCLLGYKSGQD